MVRARLVSVLSVALVALTLFTASPADAARRRSRIPPCTVHCELPAGQRPWVAQTDTCRPLADSGEVRLTAHCMLDRYWTASSEHACADYIVSKEAPAWNLDATNGRTWGFPQARPGSKMATHGRDWKTSALVQGSWFADYMLRRYKTPCRAADHKRRTGWY